MNATKPPSYRRNSQFNSAQLSTHSTQSSARADFEAYQMISTWMDLMYRRRERIVNEN